MKQTSYIMKSDSMFWYTVTCILQEISFLRKKNSKKSVPLLLFLLSLVHAHTTIQIHIWTDLLPWTTDIIIPFPHSPFLHAVLGRSVFCHANFIPLIHSLFRTMLLFHSTFRSYHRSGHLTYHWHLASRYLYNLTEHFHFSVDELNTCNSGQKPEINPTQTDQSALCRPPTNSLWICECFGFRLCELLPIQHKVWQLFLLCPVVNLLQMKLDLESIQII